MSKIKNAYHDFICSELPLYYLSNDEKDALELDKVIKERMQENLEYQMRNENECNS